MRLFYSDEGPIDTLLQIADRPVWDGDLISKSARDAFVQQGWVDRCQGWNIITGAGKKTIDALKLWRVPAGGFAQVVAEQEKATGGDIAGPSPQATATAGNTDSGVPDRVRERLRRTMVEIEFPGGVGVGAGKLTNYGAGCIVESLGVSGFKVVAGADTKG